MLKQDEAIELSLFIRGITLEFPHIFKGDITLKLESLGLEKDRRDYPRAFMAACLCVE